MTRRTPIAPAIIDFSDPLAPRATAFDDVYHSRDGAAAQAAHVFLGGNGLPQRWRGRPRFTILETGFGLGHNFLATWQAWRDDAHRCERLWFVSIEKHPAAGEDLSRAHAAEAGKPDDRAAALVAAWPLAIAGLHPRAFEAGRLRLLLAFGDAGEMLRELVLQADAFYLDGFAPARNPAMWNARVWPSLARLAADGATAATWSVAGEVRHGLESAGFAVERAPGFGGKREMTVARFAPRHRAAPPGARRPAAVRDGADPHALIVGAGLAGAAAVRALAAAGWRCTVVDAAPVAAGGASGNPAGLFHGWVGGADGVHARWLRAAALQAEREWRAAIEETGVAGRVDGLLRIDPLADDVEEMAQRAAAARGFALPEGFAQAVPASEASDRAGIRLRHCAWLLRGGGWIDPRASVDSVLRGQADRFVTGRRIAVLRRGNDEDAGHGGWQALDDEGRLVARADIAVLANAGDAVRLLAARGAPPLPLASVRGQLTIVGAATAAAVGWRGPCLPLAGSGFLLAHDDGRLICGATAQPGDDDPATRAADHVRNLDQLERLIGWRPAVDPSTLDGRVAWRCVADDRLPLVGPAAHAGVPGDGAQRLDQPRHVPRDDGLYLLTALASRGLAQASLAGEVLAAWVTGAPMPVEASLVDAIDPARFVSRAVRRADPPRR